MCLGSKGGSSAPPPPNPPTTFDYNVANRNQTVADGKVSQIQAGKTVSSTFGSELGAAAPKPAGAY